MKAGWGVRAAGTCALAAARWSRRQWAARGSWARRGSPARAPSGAGTSPWRSRPLRRSSAPPRSLGVPPAAFAGGPGTAVACAAGIAACAAEGGLLALLAPRIDRTAVIVENALYADLQPFGPFSPLDPQAVADYRRRRKLAARLARGVRFRLPLAFGAGVLVSRAALSHLRQYGGLPSLLAFGASAAPLGVLALAGAGGPVTFLFWLAALVVFPQGAREATRAFRDDLRMRLVRDRLPFGTLSLLALDSLPG
ncbi:MAG: hypothetical protein ACLVKI_04635, partial [Gordonibacter urolithinfaciens]